VIIAGVGGVGGKVRRWWPWAVFIVLVVSVGALLLHIMTSPHGQSQLGAWAGVAGIVGVPIAVFAVIQARRAPQSEAGHGRTLDELADFLAEAVKSQWDDAARDRELLQPIPVRWKGSARRLTGPVSAAVESQQFRPLPGLVPVGPKQLRGGGLQDLHAVYGGLGSGRLVIVGPPGSGKTGAAVLLIRAALDYRKQLIRKKDRQLAPVPVLFTLHEWDPSTQRVEDWLARRLQQTYPMFGEKGGEEAAALLKDHRIAVILDGLDEIPEQLRPIALRELSKQADFRLVVLGRSDETAAAARQRFLVGAVALELEDIDSEVAADYLERIQLDPPPAGWGQLTVGIRDAPGSPIAKALSSPLTLTLVRDTYSAGDDVGELLAFRDAAGPGVLRQDIEDYLLDRLLPAVYARQPGEDPPRYEVPAARRALGYVAARMNKDGTRDLAWWRIPDWASGLPRLAATCLVVGLSIALMIGLGLGLGQWFGVIHWYGSERDLVSVSLLIGIGIGLVTGSFFLSARKSPKRITSLQWRQFLSKSSLGVSVLLGITLGFWIGLFTGLSEGPGAGVTVGLVSCLVASFSFSLVLGLQGALTEPAGNASPLSPLASWRRDQRFALIVGLVAGLIGAPIVGFAFGRGLEYATGLLIGLIFGLVVWLAFGLASPSTWPASLAFVQLRRSQHTPVRLMRFLEDARKRGILRTVGPVYQFRHARLQDRLAAQATSANLATSAPAVPEPAATTGQAATVVDVPPL
jgi:hypothetical protein